MKALFLTLLLGFFFFAGLAQTPTNVSSEPVVQLAKNDLAARLHVPANQIELVNLVEVTWDDACLGANVSGFACAQVTTPGYVLSLRANGKTYIYHTNHVQAILTN